MLCLSLGYNALQYRPVVLLWEPMQSLLSHVHTAQLTAPVAFARARQKKLTSDVAALHWMTWAQMCSTPPAHWQPPLGVFVKTWQACHVKTTA